MFRKLALVLSVFVIGAGSTLAQAASLAGSEWSPSAQSSLPQEKRQFIQFQSDGRVAGFTGCNRFFGSYESDGDSLSFGVLGATKMMCSAEAMELEQNLFESLEKVAMFKRDQHRLMLFDKDKNIVLELMQRDWD